MGLTGVILDATIDLIPIETSRCAVDTDAAADLDALLGADGGATTGYRYSVAWIDLIAKGRHLGRSVLTRGDHATARPARARATPSTRSPTSPASFVAVPPARAAAGRAQPLHAAAFNEVWYRKAPAHRIGQIAVDPGLLPPARLRRLVEPPVRPARLRAVPVRRAVRRGGRAARVVERLAASGTASFLTVLKRFGAANPAPLSFPTPGWTLTLDIPAAAARAGDAAARPRRPGARRRRAPLPRQGRPHDARRHPPRLPAAGRVAGGSRTRSIPSGVWASDLARRLGCSTT